MQKTYRIKRKEIIWSIFEHEVVVHFSPTKHEDYDESLSRIQQRGSLGDYQAEFEKLANRVEGLSQKVLVETFLGGLKEEILEGIRMFKPKTLRETIELARMQDDHLNWTRQGTTLN
jgi:hypothetical protein